MLLKSDSIQPVDDGWTRPMSTSGVTCSACSKTDYRELQQIVVGSDLCLLLCLEIYLSEVFVYYEFRSVRPYIDFKTANTNVNSKLDYCNSL